MKEPTLSKLPGTFIGYDASPIDIDILKQLKEHDIDINYARKCIEANKHNSITSTYYLMLKKHIRGGGESIADARKPEYDPKVFMKRVPNFKNLHNADGRDNSKEREGRAVATGPSPSLRFNSNSPGGTIMSPSTRFSYAHPNVVERAKGNPPVQIRKIADGLGDLERYSERKKSKSQIKKKRAVSTYIARAQMNASD